MLATALTLLASSTTALVLQPSIGLRPHAMAQSHHSNAPVRMADSQKDEELKKDIPFAGYDPSSMQYKNKGYRNTPLGGDPGKALSGPSKFIPYAAVLAVIGLATGGFTEQYVEQAFAPVREAGGYGALLKVPDAPGMEKARELKEIQKAKRQELIQNLQGGAP